MKLTKRQSNAAVALLQMSQSAQVWPLLRHGPDPTLRSYLIHRLGPFGVDAQTIVDRLDEELEVPICRALILSLGTFTEESLTPKAKDLLIKRLQNLYRTAADPGLHAAAEWLLRRCQEERWIRASAYLSLR